MMTSICLRSARSANMAARGVELFAEIEVDLLQGQFAGLHLGEIQDVVDEQQQGVRRGFYLVEIVPLLLIRLVCSARALKPMMAFMGCGSRGSCWPGSRSWPGQQARMAGSSLSFWLRRHLGVAATSEKQSSARPSTIRIEAAFEGGGQIQLVLLPGRQRPGPSSRRSGCAGDGTLHHLLVELTKPAGPPPPSLGCRHGCQQSAAAGGFVQRNYLLVCVPAAGMVAQPGPAPVVAVLPSQPGRLRHELAKRAPDDYGHFCGVEAWRDQQIAVIIPVAGSQAYGSLGRRRIVLLCAWLTNRSELFDSRLRRCCTLPSLAFCPSR